MRRLVVMNHKWKRCAGRLRASLLCLRVLRVLESHKLLPIWLRPVWQKESAFSSWRKSKLRLMQYQRNSKRSVLIRFASPCTTSQQPPSQSESSYKPHSTLRERISVVSGKAKTLSKIHYKRVLFPIEMR